MKTDTATETQVALAVAAPQSPAEALFGAGAQVREPGPLAGLRWEIRVDPGVAQRLSEAIAKCLAVPAREWRAQTHGSFAPSIPLPVGQVPHPAYRPEHWHSVYDWRAAAACCTPSRRAMTGSGYRYQSAPPCRPLAATGSLGGKVAALGHGGEGGE